MIYEILEDAFNILLFHSVCLNIRHKNEFIRIDIYLILFEIISWLWIQERLVPSDYPFLIYVVNQSMIYTISGAIWHSIRILEG